MRNALRKVTVNTRALMNLDAGDNTGEQRQEGATTKAVPLCCTTKKGGRKKVCAQEGGESFGPLYQTPPRFRAHLTGTPDQAPTVPRKNLLCCGMLQHASSRRVGVPKFSSS